MKVSAFTFIKNGQILGYPFLHSIKSILPIVDEFIINVGKSEDDTLNLIKSLSSKKIRIIESTWSDKIQDRGYVYGQQKMIAQFNCSGDWAFYVEGDEIYHEKDLNQIKQSMEKHLNNSNDPLYWYNVMEHTNLNKCRLHTNLYHHIFYIQYFFITSVFIFSFTIATSFVCFKRKIKSF